MEISSTHAGSVHPSCDCSDEKVSNFPKLRTADSVERGENACVLNLLIFTLRLMKHRFFSIAAVVVLAITVLWVAGCEQKTETVEMPAPQASLPPANTTPPPEEATPPPKQWEIDKFYSTAQNANIAFNTPDSLAYGETRVIELLLDATKSVAELEAAITEEGTKQGAQIHIAERMEAHLTGDGFDITKITGEAQPVSRTETTKWKWEVRPKRFGQQSLHLAIDAVVIVEGERSTRSIRTFDRDIMVNVRWPTTFIAYPQDHDEIATGLVGAVAAFFTWFFGFRKKKPANTEPDLGD